MISYQIIEHGRPLQKVLAETPKPQGSEVLMRVTRAGVCHSDLHIWEGYFDLGGDKRLVYPWIGCGKCAVCKSGQDNYCVSGTRFLGVNRPGAYATHVLVPDAKYLIDTAGIDDAFASTLACSAITAYSGIAKLPPLG